MSSTAASSVRIARMFHWEMGHRLPFHSAGCANIHGHSYKLWVELEGEADEKGMLMDYGDLKAIVMPVLDPLDHAFMVDEGDQLMRSFLASTAMKTYLVPFHSTAENIAAHLCALLAPRLGVHPRVHRLRLRLQETDNSYAETGCDLH